MLRRWSLWILTWILTASTGLMQICYRNIWEENHWTISWFSKCSNVFFVFLATENCTYLTIYFLVLVQRVACRIYAMSAVVSEVMPCKNSRSPKLKPNNSSFAFLFTMRESENTSYLNSSRHTIRSKSFTLNNHAAPMSTFFTPVASGILGLSWHY